MECFNLETEQSREIIILLSNTGTMFSKTIEKFTGEPYTHVSISFDYKLNELYSFGRKRPRNPFFAGFVREDVHNGLLGLRKNTTCGVYTMSVSEAQYQQMKKTVREFRKNKGIYGYNLIGFLGVIVNRPISRKYNYFCSQFVTTVLEKSGVDLFGKPAGLVTPRDFRESNALKLIFCGKLAEYKKWQSGQQHLFRNGKLIFNRFESIGGM